MNKYYEEHGYVVVKNFVSENDVMKLHEIASQFHQSWRRENARFYADKAVNSAYLTAKKHLKNAERESLFKFIGSARFMEVVVSILGSRATFMNTQLFFDPVNELQKNYWHRDPQYHMSIEEQQQALPGPKVVHFRIPLREEPGVELIPGTHSVDLQAKLIHCLHRILIRFTQPLWA